MPCIFGIFQSVRKEDVKKIFGSSVKGRRKQLGISQEQLAERADLHRTYVSDVERGSRNISLENIERLASALDVSVSALFRQDEMHSGNGAPKNINGHARNLVNVLLVEDNPDDIDLALKAFKKARFLNRVHCVHSGEEALEYVFREDGHAGRSGNPPELILLDLYLPGINGLEVLRRIKADARMRSVPVVVLTGSNASADIAESRRLGAETYIVKPVNISGLVAATPRLNLNWALLKPHNDEP